MRAWGRIIFAVTAVLALLAPTATRADGASAQPGFEVQERSLRSTVSIQGSNGFQGSITTTGHKQVTLLLQRADEKLELRARGRVSRRAIVARFGDFGKVSLRFRGRAADAPSLHPLRRSRSGDSAPRCSGRNPIIERGVFRGIIQLDGENDFTQIEAKRAPGLVERRFQRVCRQSPAEKIRGRFEEQVQGQRLTQLEARARVGGVNVTFNATVIVFGSILGVKLPPIYGFSAHAVERREGMRVVRAVQLTGDEHNFLASKPGATPQTVTVVPPPPFVKTAKHLKEHSAPATWVGPLAVRLPGAGLVPLTGPGFRSAFCNLTFASFEEGERCLPRRGDEPSPDSMALLADALARGSGGGAGARRELETPPR